MTCEIERKRILGAAVTGNMLSAADGITLVMHGLIHCEQRVC